MKATDILYTPLDTPDVPNVDIPKLLSWVAKHTFTQEISGRQDASKVAEVSESYPWNIIYPRHNSEWQFAFNKEFPELAHFFYNAFGMNEEDLFSVVLLPVKTEFAGMGFWHSDPDEYGLRLYLENQEPDDFLMIRPTKYPYDTRPMFGLDPSFKDTPLQDKTFSAKLRNPKQTFYLNNIRAVHAVQTFNPGTVRIAVIVSSQNRKLKQHFNDLVVKSAQKYSDYAIIWNPE